MDPEALKKELEELNIQIAEADASVAPLEEEQNALKAAEAKAYQEYQAMIVKLRADRSKLDEAAFEARTRKNRLKREAEEKQRLLEQAMREAKEREAALEAEMAMLVLQDKWDRLTMGAPWRELAKDHQIKASKFITENRKVILADGMGLGKTLSAIITCDMASAATKLASKSFPFMGEEKQVWVPSQYTNKETNETIYYTPYDFHSDPDKYEVVEGHHKTEVVNGITRPVGKKVLYVCPAPLIRNVLREFRLWAPHRNVIFIGGMSKAARQFALELLEDRADYTVIVNYEAWRKDLNLIKELVDLKFDTVILDEAHIVKEMKTGAYQGVSAIIRNGNPEYVIPMTGTPILNRPQELFSLLTLVLPEVFHTINDFLYSYCQQDEDKNQWYFKPGGLDLISKRINRNFLRRTREQAGIVLPPRTIKTHDIEVDKEVYAKQEMARKQMRQYMTILVDEAKGKAITATVVIAMLTRLRQIETWPAGIVERDPITKEVKVQLDVEESQKLDYAISAKPDSQGDYNGIIPDVIADERVVVFSQFKAPLLELERRVRAAGYRPVVLTGDTPQKLRDEAGLDFDLRSTPDKSQAKWDIALCNYRVGGVGLNFTAATQMVIIDEEWNPGKRDQAYDRIYRMGQESPVTVHVLRTKDTVDDWLAGIMDAKEGLVDGFNSKMSVEGTDFIDALKGGLL